MEPMMYILHLVVDSRLLPKGIRSTMGINEIKVLQFIINLMAAHWTDCIAGSGIFLTTTSFQQFVGG